MPIHLCAYQITTQKKRKIKRLANALQSDCDCFNVSVLLQMYDRSGRDHADEYMLFE